MDGVSAAFIFVGAGFGALLRWGLGLLFNPVFPTLPLGTLAANVLGGFLMGISMALFTRHAAMPPVARLAMTTGFLGGLTTFSTFSAETLTLLQRGQYGWAGGIVAAHVGASLVATFLGFALVGWLASLLS